MSFIEGISTVSVDVADAALVVCLTSALILVVSLLAIPAVASTLRVVWLQRALERLYYNVKAAVRLRRDD